MRLEHLPANLPPIQHRVVVPAAARQRGRLVLGQLVALPAHDRARLPGARGQQEEERPSWGGTTTRGPPPTHRPRWPQPRARRSAGSASAACASTPAAGPPEAFGPGAEAGTAAPAPVAMLR